MAGKFTEQCTKCLSIGDYEGAVKAALKAIELENCFDAYLCAGRAYYMKGEPNKALRYLERAKTLAQKQEEFAIVYNKIGVTYIDVGDFGKALECLFKSLRIARELNDIKGITTALDDIAGFFYYKGDLDKALEYHKESLKYWPIDNVHQIGTTYNNIATVYSHKQDYTNAIAYYKKAIDYAEKGGDYLGVGAGRLNLGEAHREVKDYRNAKRELLEGLKMVQTVGDKYREGHGHLCLAALNRDLGQYKTAKDYCLKAIEILEKIGVKQGLNAAISLLSKIEKKLQTSKKGKQRQ